MGTAETIVRLGTGASGMRDLKHPHSHSIGASIDCPQPQCVRAHMCVCARVCLCMCMCVHVCACAHVCMQAWPSHPAAGDEGTVITELLPT